MFANEQLSDYRILTSLDRLSDEYGDRQPIREVLDQAPGEVITRRVVIRPHELLPPLTAGCFQMSE